MVTETESSQEVGASGSTPHSRIVFAWHLSGLVLLLLTLVVAGNAVSNFLHAPIGIKDNPPDPELLVQFARIAIYPVGILFIGLGLLIHMAETMSAKDILWIFVGVVAFALSTVPAVFLIGVALHREIIPGSNYLLPLFRLVFRAILFILPLVFLVVDLYAAYWFFASWKPTKARRDKCAALLVGFSTCPAVVAFIGHCMPIGESFFRNPLWVIAAFSLFFGGLACESQPAQESQHKDVSGRIP
jgi:hypothetical protein